MDERPTAFGLRVVPEKTALLHFDGSLLQGGPGRPADKPGTFTFLGFTHYYLTTTRRGTITIGRTPSVKARERFVRKVRTWVKVNRHHPVKAQQAHLSKMLNGFYQYFGLLHPHAQWGPAASPRGMVLGVAASEPEEQAAPRLGNGGGHPAFRTTSATTDTGLGVAIQHAARPSCSTGGGEVTLPPTGLSPAGNARSRPGA